MKSVLTFSPLLFCLSSERGKENLNGKNKLKIMKNLHQLHLNLKLWSVVFCRKPIVFGTLAIHWNDDFAYKNKERMKI